MDTQWPISVLHVLGTVGRAEGGSAPPGLGIATATRDGGDDVTVLTTRGRGEVLPGIPGTEIVGMPRQGPACLSIPLAIWLWRNIRRFDLVEVHDVLAFPALAVWAAARLRGGAVRGAPARLALVPRGA